MFSAHRSVGLLNLSHEIAIRLEYCNVHDTLKVGESFDNCVDLTKELNRRSGCLNIAYTHWTSATGISTSVTAMWLSMA